MGIDGGGGGVVVWGWVDSGGRGYVGEGRVRVDAVRKLGGRKKIDDGLGGVVETLKDSEMRGKSKMG